VNVTGPTSLGHSTTFLGGNTYRYQTAGFTLGGTGEDPETLAPDKNVTYAWTVASQADAAAVVEITNPLVKDAVVTIRKDAAFSCPATNPGLLGDYTLQLTVTDRSGASASTTHTVQVTNAAPTGVSAGSDVTVDHFYSATTSDYRANVSPSGQASASDNGDPTCRTWHMGGNTGDDCAVGSGSVSIASQTSGVPSAIQLAGPTSLVNNTHKLCVKEVDAWGLASCDCTLVSVTNRAPNRPSVGLNGTTSVGHSYTSGFYTATVPSVTAGALSDPDNDPMTHRWYVSGASAITVSGPAPGTTGSLTLQQGSPGTSLVGPTLSVCLEAKDVFNVTAGEGAGQNCQSLTVTNRAPLTPTVGFGDQSVPHSDQSPNFVVTLTASPSAFVDADMDPPATPGYRWLVTNVSGVTAAGPAPGTTGTLTLTSTTPAEFVGQTLRTCVEMTDVFGLTSALVDGSSCRNVAVTNSAPSLTTASATETKPVLRQRTLNAQAQCICSTTKCTNGEVRLSATATDVNGGTLTYTWTRTSEPLAGCAPATSVQSCTAGVACSINVPIMSASCGGVYTWSVQAVDGRGAMSTPITGVTATVSTTCTNTTCDDC
jgi:hypothetical protein